MRPAKKPAPKGQTEEATEQGHRFKFSGTPPKEVIESALASALAECFHTLGVTAFGASEKLTTEESFAAAVAIVRATFDELNYHLGTCQLKTLTPRHQNFKRLLPYWQIRAEFIAEVIKEKTETDPDVKAAGRELVEILTWFHILFDQKTPAKMAKEMTDAYIEESTEKPS